LISLIFFCRAIVRQLRSAIKEPVCLLHHIVIVNNIYNRAKVMSGRDKIVCLFDVDGTLTAPMKASLIFLWGKGTGVVTPSRAREAKQWE
jgi:hypothetical protein